MSICVLISCQGQGSLSLGRNGAMGRTTHYQSRKQTSDEEFARKRVIHRKRHVRIFDSAPLSTIISPPCLMLFFFPSPFPSSPPPPDSLEMESLAHDARWDLESPPRHVEHRGSSEVRHFPVIHTNQQQFTTRAVVVGLLVGTIVNFSNMYFGLQSQ